ncbi:MAG TPA: stage II sporulation protein M [Steroidobacteraceae bacterium]|nr:stage II sporulation protein M [Steroidobacteraceae bacterium]
MTPLQFEALYQSEWQELEGLLQRFLGGRRKADGATPQGERLAALYRRVCEQLALARARSYPAYMLDRLERLTGDAHQAIYQRREFGIAALRRLVSEEFPVTVRAHAAYILVAAALLVLPTLIVGLLVYYRPDLILAVVDARTAASFEQMYSPVAGSIGRLRGANTDWVMFGYYIMHNIGISFQCFAGGLIAGVGSIFFLIYNGASIGAVAGYLTQRGLGVTFYPFVATHSAFELTAIVLAGAAGLRLGHSLLVPGRSTRLQSLVSATRRCTVLLYGSTVMLVIAAGIEAFWSSAPWLPPGVKYGVASLCWLSVLGYLTLQGRRRAG